MNNVRSIRATYVAAFLLGALIALLIAAPVRGAESMQLDRLAVVRFTAEPDAQLRQQNAVLHDDGRFLPRASFVISRPANTPEWVLGRNLVPVEAWAAYYNLGYNALGRFELHDGGARVHIGEQAYLLVAPSFEVSLADGRLANISARVRLADGGDVATAGFFVDDRSRVVLIRAIGPGLQRFGVTAPVADPFLSVKKGGTTVYFNDNWSTAGEASAIRTAATRVGAFPLDEESRDAARLIELPPGAYTVQVENASPAGGGGEVLIEIYSVPADVLE